MITTQLSIPTATHTNSLATTPALKAISTQAFGICGLSTSFRSHALSGALCCVAEEGELSSLRSIRITRRLLLSLRSRSSPRTILTRPKWVHPRTTRLRLQPMHHLQPTLQLMVTITPPLASEPLRPTPSCSPMARQPLRRLKT